MTRFMAVVVAGLLMSANFAQGASVYGDVSLDETSPSSVNLDFASAAASGQPDQTISVSPTASYPSVSPYLVGTADVGYNGTTGLGYTDLAASSAVPSGDTATRNALSRGLWSQTYRLLDANGDPLTGFGSIVLDVSSTISLGFTGDFFDTSANVDSVVTIDQGGYVDDQLLVDSAYFYVVNVPSELASGAVSANAGAFQTASLGSIDLSQAFTIRFESSAFATSTDGSSADITSFKVELLGLNELTSDGQQIAGAQLVAVPMPPAALAGGALMACLSLVTWVRRRRSR